MKAFYVDDCDCAGGTRAAFSAVYEFDDEKKAVALHRKLWRRLVLCFGTLDNNERYWAIHVKGRHLISVKED